MAAKKIQLLVTGKRKSELAAKLVNGEKTNMLPGSLLKDLSQVEIVLDSAASGLLNTERENA